MTELFNISIIIVCLTIFYQDMKDRLISVALFMLLIGFLMFKIALNNQNEDIYWILFSNLLFIFGQVAFLFVYFKFIRKKTEFFDSIFGWGDVWMMVCMSLVFPLPQFICFLLISYIIGIGYALFHRKKETTIPLAGIMSGLFVLVTIVNMILNNNVIETFHG